MLADTTKEALLRKATAKYGRWSPSWVSEVKIQIIVSQITAKELNVSHSFSVHFEDISFPENHKMDYFKKNMAEIQLGGIHPLNSNFTSSRLPLIKDILLQFGGACNFISLWENTAHSKITKGSL